MSSASFKSTGSSSSSSKSDETKTSESENSTSNKSKAETKISKSYYEEEYVRLPAGEDGKE